MTVEFAGQCSFEPIFERPPLAFPLVGVGGEVHVPFLRSLAPDDRAFVLQSSAANWSRVFEDRGEHQPARHFRKLYYITSAARMRDGPRVVTMSQITSAILIPFPEVNR